VTAVDGVEYTPRELDRDAPFYVAGHRGLVGSAIWRKLEASGFTDLHGKPSADLDLKDRDDVFAYMSEVKPKYVVLAAAKVGGILANSTYPVDFLSDNMRIQVNVLDAALANDVERVLFLGSSCIYPKFADQPIREDSLLTGHLEETNDAYAIAKIAGILQTQAVRRQYGLPWISAMPTNLYGPNDNFSPKGSHVLPALIRRYDEAAQAGAGSVTNWGTGTPRREFLHADDMADACLHLLEHYDGGTPRSPTARRRSCWMCRSWLTRGGPRRSRCRKGSSGLSRGTATTWVHFAAEPWPIDTSCCFAYAKE
jgi:GDP-L-fucose synthase